MSPRSAVPARVKAMLQEREYVLLAVPGVADSGIALTTRRILAWRGAGTAPAMPLEVVGGAAWDRSLPHPTLLVAPDVASGTPIALLLDPGRRRMADKLLNVLPGVLAEFERAAGRTIHVEHATAGEFTRLRFIRPSRIGLPADG